MSNSHECNRLVGNCGDVSLVLRVFRAGSSLMIIIIIINAQTFQVFREALKVKRNSRMPNLSVAKDH